MKLVSLALPLTLTTSLGACALANTAQDESDWRDAVSASPSTAEGCFHAAYPDTTWASVACTTAPNRPFAQIPAGNTQFTVGNGDDYALEVSSGLISESIGTFPKVTDLTSEKDGSTKNEYSIQLNSNFMSGTAACSKGESNCQSWAQFVYSSSEESAFLQNWLIGYGDSCPSSDWNSDGQGDCYINSKAASVPTLPLTSDSDLSELKITGKAANGGKDSLVFANGTDAYSTSEEDSVTNLASAWTSSEFNIIGDGGGTEAVFDKSASIEVKIAVKDGSTSAPTCAKNAGTTGETNNRDLGTCKASSGSEPSIEFTESGTK